MKINVFKFILALLFAIPVFGQASSVDVSKAANVGQSVTFSVSADGTAPFSYQWRKDGVNISGAVASSFIIPAADLTSAGVYSATISNSAGSIASPNATLAVIAPPPAVPTGGLFASTDVPKLIDQGPDNPVELGMKFTSSAAGSITGIRFYKSAGNTGAHVGNLWSSAGVLLASATFANETASGWQQVNFATPVTITANTVYVASYHVIGGHYSADANYFTAAKSTPPLSGSNGVYSYGAASVFPTLSFNATNYWVDAVFKAAPAVLAPSAPSISVDVK